MKSKAIFILPPHGTDIDAIKRPPWGIVRIPPIGLLSIGSYLQAKGHDIKIIDGRELVTRYKTKEYIPLILKIVDEFKPDIIGINILTALFDEAKAISRELKRKFPNSIVIAGGPHPSVEPVLTFQQNQYLDAMCIGHGEEVCLDILDGKKLNRIPGLMHRGCIDRFEKRSPELDIDKYPFPNYALANPDFYTAFTVNTITGWGYKGLVELTSRSCPYSCKFCASDWSKPFRYHSPEYVVELAKYLSTYDIDVIAFFDDTIAANKDRLCKICEGFIRSRLFWPHGSLRWFAAIRANQVNPDTLKLMKRAGCFGVSIGIESGSDRMLQVINKKTTVEMNRKACAHVREAGLHLGTSFMIGIPGETETEMNETLAFMQNINCGLMGIGTFRPLPGSPFYYEFVNNNMLSKEHLDWPNLGDFSTLPKDLFCDVPRERFEEIFDKGFNLANVNSWTAVHEDSLLKYPQLIKSIAIRTKVKIAKSDNYESSTHIAYIPFSVFSVFLIFHNILLQLYVRLPFKLRRRIKIAITELAKKKYFKELLWRY